jgi:CheY-like chemotaxis protein
MKSSPEFAREPQARRAYMKKWILLVEDQADDVFFFKSAAKKVGIAHEIEVAVDGREAVERLKRVTTAGEEIPPSLILLDLKLPYFSGLEVLEWVRQQPALKAVPTIMLTSSEQETDIDAAYALGAFGYLVKVAGPAFVNVVRAIDEFWLKHNRPPSKMQPAETRRAAAI